MSPVTVVSPSGSSNGSIVKEKDATVHLENGKVDTFGVPKEAVDLVAELESLDPQLQASLRRKYDAWILPCVTLIYLMAFIDRSNMGSEFTF